MRRSYWSSWVSRKNSRTLPILAILWISGKYFLNRFDTAGHQERGIDKIEINPWFNLKNYTHDIALLRFETPIQYSDYVRPICLWEGPRDFERIVNQRGLSIIVEQTGGSNFKFQNLSKMFASCFASLLVWHVKRYFPSRQI